MYFHIAEFTLELPAPCDLLDGWILNVDEASNNKDFGIRIVFTTLEGSITEQSFTLGFPATNNKVEYEAVITHLKMITTLSHQTRGSLWLTMVGSQVKGEYTAKDERMAAYLQLVPSLKSKFLRCDFKQIS